MFNIQSKRNSNNLNDSVSLPFCCQERPYAHRNVPVQVDMKDHSNVLNTSLYLSNKGSTNTIAIYKGLLKIEIKLHAHCLKERSERSVHRNC